MPGCKIDNMNEVADAGAVRSVIVVSENEHLLTLTNRHLRHKWQQIVRSADGVFSDEPAFVRANRVEVAQDADPPVRVGLAEILQHLLDKELRATVWVCRSEGMFLI